VRGDPATDMEGDDFSRYARWVNLIRLTDRGLQRYALAQHEFAVWASTPAGHMSPYFRALDDLEDCVVVAHRALLMAAAMRRQRRHPRGTSEMPAPSQMRALRDLRDAISHTDERLAAPLGKRPSIMPGQAYLLRPHEHHVELGGHRLTYKALATCLERCHGFTA